MQGRLVLEQPSYFVPRPSPSSKSRAVVSEKHDPPAWWNHFISPTARPMSLKPCSDDSQALVLQHAWPAMWPAMWHPSDRQQPYLRAREHQAWTVLGVNTVRRVQHDIAEPCEELSTMMP